MSDLLSNKGITSLIKHLGVKSYIKSNSKHVKRYIIRISKEIERKRNHNNVREFISFNNFVTKTEIFCVVQFTGYNVLTSRGLVGAY